MEGKAFQMKKHTQLLQEVGGQFRDSLMEVDDVSGGPKSTLFHSSIDKNTSYRLIAKCALLNHHLCQSIAAEVR